MNRRGLLGLFSAVPLAGLGTITTDTRTDDIKGLLTEIRDHLKTTVQRTPEEIEADKQAAVRRIRESKDCAVAANVREHILNRRKSGKPFTALLVGYNVRDSIEMSLIYDKRYINIIKLEGHTTPYIDFYQVPVGVDPKIGFDDIGKWLEA